MRGNKLNPTAMNRILIRYSLILLIFINITNTARAWSEHPLLAYPVLSTIPELANKQDIQVMSLHSFLVKEEAGIAKLLKEYEIWATQNLGYYPSLPEGLTFKNTGNPDDIVQRFLYAIRLNPNVKMKLYLHLLPNQEVGDQPIASPRDITTLKDISSMLFTNYVEIQEGQLVSPLMVLCTANDEPDYGFDLGLFEDNNTDYGKMYGFGVQPFGDPNLEYGSQAPFHMGFYHEAKIVFMAGPFLKRTMPEFRISLFKALAEYAFATGNDYWGYRFMGWGMHYLGDMSMPYHTAPLPGTSALKMIWINLKAMLGFPKSKDNAVQIVSNRHSVLEEYQWQIVKRAYKNDPDNNPVIQALKNPIAQVDYVDDFPRNVAALESVKRAKRINKNLKKWVPKRLVSDPKVEVPGSPELEKIIEIIKAENGQEAVDGMTGMIAELMQSYSMHLRSFYKHVTQKSALVADSQ